MKEITFRDKNWDDWVRKIDDVDFDLQKRIIEKNWWEILECNNLIWTN